MLTFTRTRIASLTALAAAGSIRRRPRRSAGSRHARGARSAGARGGDVRQRLLLVDRVRLRQGRRRPRDDVGLHGRQDQDPDVRAGLGGRHGPRRSGSGQVRPKVVSYQQLLDYYWRHVDWSTAADSSATAAASTGRSSSSPHREQKQSAEASKAELTGAGASRQPIAVEIKDAGAVHGGGGLSPEIPQHERAVLQALPRGLRTRRALKELWGNEATHEQEYPLSPCALHGERRVRAERPLSRKRQLVWRRPKDTA